jgi:tryptophanyl-tRNA synthetase
METRPNRAPETALTQPAPAMALETALVRSEEIWHELRRDPSAFRVLTGERTTGALHIGHYFGSLRNRVALQELGVEVFLVLADYQALTDRDASTAIRESVYEIVLDYLGIGIDPERSTIFAHSAIPALNQLLLPFLGVASVSELQRNPTVKDEIAQSGRASVSGLMLTYPVHQAADILFCKGNLVPGGKDQLPHLEVTRDVARRINRLYFDEPYFPEPELLMGDVPLLLGLDGEKMGKSMGNAIFLRMTADDTARLVKRARTDSDRRITVDPVHRPTVSNLVQIAALSEGAAPDAVAEEIGDGGAEALKRRVTDSLNEHLAPIRRRRLEFAADPAEVWRILREGCARAEAVADQTLTDLRRAMGMAYGR